MVWIPLGAWIGAVVVAIVVLGFCAYELVWKTNRLRRDLAHLTQLNESVGALQRELEVTQQRIAAARR